MSEPIGAAELSLLMDQHRPYEVPPCRVCGAALAVGAIGGGLAAVYHCASEEASLTDAYAKSRTRGDTSTIPDEVRKAAAHRQASELHVAYHGDRRVFEALAELRDLRAGVGEDMEVAPGAYAYPYGHANGACVARWRHLGGGRWEADYDVDFSHDPTHRVSSAAA